MATVVYSGVPGTVGLIVEVMAVCVSMPRMVARYGHLWHCKAAHGTKARIGMKYVETYAMPGSDIVIPDAWLRPIRPDELDDDTPTVEPIRESETA